MYTDKDPSDGKVSAQHIRDSLKLPQNRNRISTSRQSSPNPKSGFGELKLFQVGRTLNDEGHLA